MNELSPFAAFDDRAKRVVLRARAHADAQGGPEVGADHLLQGLLSVRRGRAARAVRAVAGPGRHPDPVRREHPSPAHLPFAVATEHAVTAAAREAARLGDDRIGTEHLLLGLFAEPSAATQALAALGVDQPRIRAEITRLRGTG